jgi:hypothetical protein
LPTSYKCWLEVEEEAEEAQRWQAKNFEWLAGQMKELRDGWLLAISYIRAMLINASFCGCCF